MSNISKKIALLDDSGKTIYIHCGAGKTGSSALQAYFYANKLCLKANNISYEHAGVVTRVDEITSGNGEYLRLALMDENISETKLEHVIESYFDSTSGSICSSEHFSYLSVSQWNCIKDACKRLNINVIVISFVRNVEPFYISAYHQLVKRHGEHRSFFDFVTEDSLIYNHVSHVKDLFKVFSKDNIRILHYESEIKFLDSSFFGSININHKLFDGSILNKKINRSLTTHELNLMKRINRITGAQFSTEISDMLIYARPNLTSAKDSDLDIISILNQRHASDIDWINASFFNGNKKIKLARVLINGEVISEMNQEDSLKIDEEVLFWSLEKLQEFSVNAANQLVPEAAKLIDIVTYQHPDVLKKCFDGSFYLDANKDVADAGLDPLQHYLDFGLAEGRLPAANLENFFKIALKEREKSIQDKLTKAYKKSDIQLIDFAARERLFGQQILETQQLHQHQLLDSDLENIEREKLTLNRFLLLQDQIQKNLIEMNERNNYFSGEVHMLKLRHEQQKGEQSRAHAEREQAHLGQHALARKQIETQLLELAAREKAFSAQLQVIQQSHEQQKGEQSREHAEREQAHLGQLALARKQIETQLHELAAREKAFSAQLQVIQQAHEQQKGEQSREHAEREQAHLGQHTLARKQIETQLLELAAREKAFSAQLQVILQAHEQQNGEQSREHAEREQEFNVQLVSRQEEFSSLSFRLAESEKAYAEVISGLHNEINAIHNTYFWRWTAPFRSKAAMQGLKNSSSSQTAIPIAIETQVNVPVTHLIAQVPETPLPFEHPPVNINNGIYDMTQINASTAATTLEELLSYHDERFVQNSFQTLLGRAPDPEGLRYYLARVRTGISKEEIVAQLSLSAEGKAKKVSIDGLYKVIKKYQRLKMPLIGALYRHFGVTNMGRSTNQKISAIENKLYTLDVQLQHHFSDISSSFNQLKELLEGNKLSEVELDNEKNFTFSIVDEKWYLDQNPDVVESGMCANEHYKLYGKKEGRHPFFDTHWYLEQYPDVEKSGVNALEHFKIYGKVEGRHPAFDRDWYLSRYPDVASNGADPLSHYILHGKAEGRYPAYSKFSADGNNYSKWIMDFDTLTNETREGMQRKSIVFPHMPLISVVMPVYNPNPIWLVEAIESVRNQIYTNWELCIADDLSPNKDIRPILEHYASIDERIRVVFRAENGHISNATNSALAVSEGLWIALLDHDDVLPDHALYWVVDAINKNSDIEMIYSDEDKMNEQGSRFGPYFKCDWNPDLFYSHNMFSHLGVYRADLIRDVGGFRIGMEGSQDYDLALRCIERISSKQIYHIPRVLYHWRVHAESTASSTEAKPYAMIAGERAINEHFERQGISAKAELIAGGYRVRYDLPEILPLVSLIIPTRNGLGLLQQCIESIILKTTYSNYEILIIDNGSDDLATLKYLNNVASDPRIRVIRDDQPFNYSALNNSAVKLARGEVIGLINNDIEVISSDWLSEMVSHAMRPEVGAVGARLWYPDDTLQHGGVVLSLGGVAGHSHKYLPRGEFGYFNRANLIQSFSAVTAACLVVRKSIYESLGGLNAINLQVAFNDVDFCIRVREAGYRNVWTPYAELYHHESASRGFEDTPEKQARFAGEVDFMKKTWGDILNYDPAYSPNLSVCHDDFRLAWPPRVESSSFS